MKNLPTGVKRVTLLRRSDLGSLSGHVVYESGGKRKGSKRLKPFEKALSRMVHERANASIIYLDRHRRSSEKKKNGWLKDMPKNIQAATEKARKHRKELLTLKDLRKERGRKARISAPVYRVTI
jgi:hypothetical protein